MEGRRRRSRGRLLTAVVVLGLAVGAQLAPPTALAAAAPQGAAPDGPGALSHFDLARKDCLGTARNRTSKVWFTVADGVLSRRLLPDRSTTPTSRPCSTSSPTAPPSPTSRPATRPTPSGRSTQRDGCRVTSTDKQRPVPDRHRLRHRPRRDSVVMRTRFEPHGGGDLRCTSRFDATVNGNGGGGERQRRRRQRSSTPPRATRCRSRSTPTPRRTPRTATTRRRSTRPGADRPVPEVTSGFAGTASDGLTQLDARPRADHDLHRRGPDGNVVQTAQVDLRPGHDLTLALGFGATQRAGGRHRRGAAATGSARRWSATPRAGAATTPGCPPPRAARARPRRRASCADTYYLAPTC